MSQPIVIPEIVSRRWREACTSPDMMSWHSIAQMISSMHINSAVYAPGSPVTDDLRTLADVAYQHARDMEPEQEAA